MGYPPSHWFKAYHPAASHPHPGFGFGAIRSKSKILLNERQRLLLMGLTWSGSIRRAVSGSPQSPVQKMQVQPTAMVSMTARWRHGPVRGGSGQRRRRTGTWLNTGTLTMLRSSCMVKGFTQPRHRHRASGRSAGMRLGSWLMLQEGRREPRVAGVQDRAHLCPSPTPLPFLTRVLIPAARLCSAGGWAVMNSGFRVRKPKILEGKPAPRLSRL